MGHARRPDGIQFITTEVEAGGPSFTATVLFLRASSVWMSSMRKEGREGRGRGSERPHRI